MITHPAPTAYAVGLDLVAATAAALFDVSTIVGLHIPIPIVASQSP